MDSIIGTAAELINQAGSIEKALKKANVELIDETKGGNTSVCYSNICNLAG